MEVKIDFNSVVSNVLTEKQNSNCRLCLREIHEEFLQLDDAVCVDTASNLFTPFREVLYKVLGLEVDCEIKALDAICVFCTETALTSYRFIINYQKCNELLENIVNNLTKTLDVDVSDLTEDKTICVVLEQDESRLLILNKNKKTNSISKKLYSCDECKTKFNTLGEYKDHSVLSHGLLVCEKCLETYPSKEELESHIKMNHRFKCSKCHQIRNSKEALQEHIDRVHGLLICKVCGKSYEGLEKLRIHEEKHNKKICPNCGKKYNTKDFFLKHKKLCLQGLLQPHAPRPKSEFPYTCEQCGKGYSTKGGLRVHNRFVHGNAKPHVCEWCNKAFTAPSYLKTHIIKHTGEKNFECKICNGKFVSKEALLYHTRRHTGEKPYNCPHCSEKFVNASARAEHIKFRHIGPTLMCEICSRKFVTSSFLKKHMSKHHDPHSKLYNKQIAIEYVSHEHCDE
ncbi:Zinc finger protein 667 [Eumeta japonica]|uniref:Zinc finger protein 667 n=1 Tax=Eumeta variegata TaxID=151549 RepID=A0A4C1UUA5_EUMVA|nr:Zinc finger protein 667 [Eumeta japonica]